MVSLSITGIALAAAIALAGCGEGDDASPSASVAPGGPGDACRLLSQGDAASILGRSDVQAGVLAAEGVCSYSTADGAATLVFDMEARSIYEFALLRSAQLHTSVRPVDGVPDAFYSTLLAATSPSPAAASPGPATTYLHVKVGSSYYSIVVQKDNKDDARLEKQAALRLLGHR